MQSLYQKRIAEENKMFEDDDNDSESSGSDDDEDDDQLGQSAVEGLAPDQKNNCKVLRYTCVVYQSVLSI